MQGLLGGANNPLFQMGMGLLSQGGYSTMPTTLGQGLQAGMQNMQQASRYQDQKTYADERLQVERERVNMEKRQALMQAKAKAEAKARAEAQRAAFPGLLNQLPEEARAGIQALYGADPSAGISAAQGLLTSAKASSLMANAQAWLNASPEERAALEKFMPKGTIINNNAGGGALKTSKPTPEQLAAAGYPRETKGLVIEDGKVKKAPQSEADTQRARRSVAREDVGRVMDAYEDAFKAYQSGLTAFGVGQEGNIADDVRLALAKKLAFYEGGGNAEPSDAAIESAYGRIPDFSGLVDAARFSARMKVLREKIMGLEPRAKSDPVADRAKKYLPKGGKP
jgi:hypothetical protein